MLGEPTKHWVWVNDLVFPHMSDGMAMLIDGDSGRYLGTLSTGWGFVRVLLPHDGKLIYSPEIYFSRGTRGVRTDVVTIYDAHTLSPVKEIQIPPKRSANMPMMANAVLTDDDRYMLIYNFTPAQSVSVVDMKSQAFVREVETPGCALVYPTGPRSFFSICGDGALSLAQIDDSGNVSLTRSAPVFSPAKDPVTEKAVRVGKTWYFVSYDGSDPSREGERGRRDGRGGLVAYERGGEEAGLAAGRPAADGGRLAFASLRHHAPGRPGDAQGPGQGRVGVRHRHAPTRETDCAQQSREFHPIDD